VEIVTAFVSTAEQSKLSILVKYCVWFELRRLQLVCCRACIKLILHLFDGCFFVDFARSVEFLYKTPPAKLEIGLQYV